MPGISRWRDYNPIGTVELDSRAWMRRVRLRVVLRRYRQGQVRNWLAQRLIHAAQRIAWVDTSIEVRREGDPDGEV